MVYRFVGQPGQYYYGVPARDLTAEDYSALDQDQRAAVEFGTLYELDASGLDFSAEAEAEPAAPRRRRSPAPADEPTTDEPTEPAPAE